MKAFWDVLEAEKSMARAGGAGTEAWWQGRRGKRTGRVYKTYQGPAGEYAESVTEAKKGGRKKRKRILEPPEVPAVVSPPAAAPEAPVAEAQAPDSNLDIDLRSATWGDIDPAIIIWGLFKDMPKDKQKDAICMLVMEI